MGKKSKKKGGGQSPPFKTPPQSPLEEETNPGPMVVSVEKTPRFRGENMENSPMDKNVAATTTPAVTTPEAKTPSAKMMTPTATTSSTTRTTTTEATPSKHMESMDFMDTNPSGETTGMWIFKNNQKKG